MRRRDFVVRLGTALVAAPFAAWAQSPDRVRRIGMLVGYAESDPDSQRRLAAFKEELAARGWKEPGNLSIDVRWTAGDVARAAPLARELVALKPELIVANTTPVTARPAVSRSCSSPSPIRSAAGSCRACRARAET
jgi:putative ABC transport system substrate-binding protein